MPYDDSDRFPRCRARKPRSRRPPRWHDHSRDRPDRRRNGRPDRPRPHLDPAALHARAGLARHARRALRGRDPGSPPRPRLRRRLRSPRHRGRSGLHRHERRLGLRLVRLHPRLFPGRRDRRPGRPARRRPSRPHDGADRPRVHLLRVRPGPGVDDSLRAHDA